ncbi:PREDICTED: phosphatidylinositol 4-kinase gamma 5-like [Tarenaya hassleriana]|uniref:1-phosphatidylinositol 4-kinase n=1 Tax=Tarenaya spinosa TaxID=228870 RepID=Q1KUZ6_9ROSI|nr:PREDICTED: phosphatidylinositol 4-kinase gamma 5-like [Tarenaya hassleriana]XP_010549981.1 PREDICTED: phosphatidylinositol 4-kinase gamma 5-like [Tarenaya hassleriana]XP_010549982.1 PREDICTED: phosphatidylinositol 4-kinase gamma 5-like [Tarenaya hassleriana]ABD96840.1 hypothetical protein [Tarenaya spinosa]
MAAKDSCSPLRCMSPEVESSVHTQMVTAGIEGAISGEYCTNRRMERTFSGTRRVFVQTDTGCVLGIEFDRRDNAHTVKRRVQLALNIPTEEKSLTCGDVVLKNDLSTVRHDSPLLLTRNLMHRSSSSPCLSPTSKDLQQRDFSCPIEILGYSNCFSKTKRLAKEIEKAMELGIDPVPVCSGLGGAYYFRDRRGENCAIVKPTDEEPYAPNNPKGFVGKSLGQPGLKRSVRVGETGFREVAAYLLDHDHFANVPPTALVKVTHRIFNLNEGVNINKHQMRDRVGKIASLQQYIPHDFDASDYGTSGFPVSAVHKIGILDIRILNTDRHAGNLLVRQLEDVAGFSQVELVPIDHGLCLPENLEDPYFEWIHWPQSSIPFSEEELEYIANLDPFRDSDMLRMELPMIREACLRVLVLCTTFLKKAAVFGLCLAEIGEMMSREFRGDEEEPSELELLCMEARTLLRDTLPNRDQSDSDCEEQKSKASASSNTLFELDELEELDKGKSEKSGISRIPTCPRLPTSMKENKDRGKSGFTCHGIPRKGQSAGRSLRQQSLNKESLGSSSFVKLSDMSEEEWLQYLEIFQKMLNPAFTRRNSSRSDQKLRHRLGTSCRF